MNRGGTVIHGLTKHDATVDTFKFINIGAGDNTQNRAVAHGLGKVPLLAVMLRGDAMVVHNMSSRWAGDTVSTVVTAMDILNIYIGEAGGGSTNGVGNTYQVIVLG